MLTQTELTLQQFLAASDGPFVTLYLPLTTHDGDKLRLKMRHLTDHAQAVMAETWPTSDWADFGSQLGGDLLDAAQLARLDGAGLCVIVASGARYTRTLAYPVQETAMVTALPQVLPLILDVQRQFDFDLLTLATDRIALYRNDGDHLTQVALPEDAPVTLEAALGTELRGGGLNSVSRGAGHVGYHGHNEKAAVAEVDRRRYYQAVDAYIADHYSKPFGRRLIPAGLRQNLAVFRQISKNPHLSGSMQLELNAYDLSLQELDVQVDALRLDHSLRDHQKTLAEIDYARGSARFSDDLATIAASVADGAVATLVIQQGARINALLNPDFTLDRESPRAVHNNLLNDLADYALARGGQVRVLPAELLAEPVCAVLRY
ncbi:baeRF6 domain-containing protein [Lacticaseibacillus suihuaensis]